MALELCFFYIVNALCCQDYPDSQDLMANLEIVVSKEKREYLDRAEYRVQW